MLPGISAIQSAIQTRFVNAQTDVMRVGLLVIQRNTFSSMRHFHADEKHIVVLSNEDQCVEPACFHSCKSIIIYILTL